MTKGVFSHCSRPNRPRRRVAVYKDKWEGEIIKLALIRTHVT